MTAVPMETADQRLASNMRNVRHVAGLSQAAVAEAMTERGYTWHQQTVYRVEAGRQQVRLAEAVALAEVLGVTLDRLMLASLEADALEAVLSSSAGLMQATVDVSRTVCQLLVARDEAERVLAATENAHWPQVRDMRTVLARRAEQCTLDEAIALGISRYEKRSDAKKGKDDDDAGPGQK